LAGKENGAKPTRKEIRQFHDAAVEAFRYGFYHHEKNGDVAIAGEHRLSKGPFRIDMVIKKRPGAETESGIGRIFRGHNIAEYKRHAAPPLTLNDFYKTAYSYAGTYAWQEDVKLTDMTATIICYKKPEELFDTLRKEFNYKVLRKYDGIYYISCKGVPDDKALAIQVVVAPELPESEFLLKALMPISDRETAEKVLEIFYSTDERSEILSCWKDVVLSVNENNILFKEAFMMDGWTKWKKKMRKEGLLEDYRQEWRQEGMQEGMQKGMQKVLALLDEETKQRVQLALS
jgi:hypothetical protein